MVHLKLHHHPVPCFDLLHRGSLTCDIWGLKLISFRSTDPGERLCNIWHRRTPSLRAWAKSNTAEEGHTTRWFGGRTLQSINHRPHCLHSSIPAPDAQTARVLERRASGRASGRAGRCGRGAFPLLSKLSVVNRIQVHAGTSTSRGGYAHFLLFIILKKLLSAYPIWRGRGGGVKANSWMWQRVAHTSPPSQSEHKAGL